MRRFVIGTAGHVDHGKTTLVRALTGVDTDRLAEEKRRGMTLELGFAPWPVAADLEATIIDVPGHRRLVHTMIAGASGIQLVLMVVAANEGVMPQTREHARVCEELGITQAVVVLTKSDLVDRETMEMAEAEARELLAERFDIDVVPCSAAREMGLDVVRSVVASRLRQLAPDKGDRHVRLWVDRVLHVRGAGTVVAGTLVSGSIARGAGLVLHGRGELRRVIARELHVHGRAVDHVESPTRLAVNLAIASSEVHRGDLVSSDADLRTTRSFDAEFRGTSLRQGGSFAFHVGTTRVAARVTRAELLGDGEQLVRLVIDEPRPISGGDRYVLRGSAMASKGGSLAGGGTVLDARPHPRSRGESRRRMACALREANPKAILACLLAEVAPRVLDLATLGGRLAIFPPAIARATDAGVADGSLVACGAGVIPRTILAELADEVRASVAAHARHAPLDRGLPLATLRQKLAERAGPDAAEAAIRAACAQRSVHDCEAVAIAGDVAVPARRSGQLDPALARTLERAQAELGDAGVHGISVTRVAEVTRAPPDRVRAVLASLERQGAAVRTGDLWFASAVVANLRARLVEHLARAVNMTVLEFKTLGGLPRKQAVLLLEHFDQVGITRRDGEVRVLLRVG